MTAREFFAQWYMGRVAGRCCPCEWPVKVRFLIRLCGRIDDVYAHYEDKQFARWYMAPHNSEATTSGTSGQGASVKWKVR